MEEDNELSDSFNNYFENLGVGELDEDLNEGENLGNEEEIDGEEEPEDFEESLRTGKQLKGFSIRTVIDDDDEELGNMDENDLTSVGTTNTFIKQLDDREILRKLENKQRLVQKRKKGDKSMFEDFKYTRNERGIVVAKPFDYQKLRKSEQKKGVVFLQNPLINSLETNKQISSYFSKYGKVLRIERKIFTKVTKEEMILGFYIEFSKKRMAEKVMEMVNNKPFSKRFPKLLTLRLLDNFDWGQLYNVEDKKKVLGKYLKVEVAKELRKIREYKGNVKISQKMKTVGMNGLNKRVKHKQKNVRNKENMSTSHLDVIKFF